MNAFAALRLIDHALANYREDNRPPKACTDAFVAHYGPGHNTVEANDAFDHFYAGWKAAERPISSPSEGEPSGTEPL